MLGASFSEIGLVALLVVLIVVAPYAPRIGEVIGGLFGKSADKPDRKA